MNTRPSPFGDRLAQAPPAFFSAWCVIAAFSAYFCMYAFRKPYTAGAFEDEELWGLGYKTVLVVSQLLGYTTAKFIGIKVISEMPAQRRAPGILVLIGIAHAALLLFALVPPPWNFACLFFNGLPLGMVFGLVLAYLEGRQLTEALAAGLCASFIVSSGVVKSVGRWLVLEHGVSEYWMPFLTGLLFVPPLLLSVWMLRQIPPPSSKDIEQRSERPTMTREDRSGFFRRHALGLAMLVGVYVLITVLRSIRDDFAVEIWTRLGESGKPSIFAQTETLVMIGVMVAAGSAIVIRNNRRAFLVAIVAVLVGFALVIGAVLGYRHAGLAPFAFMVLTGFGLYIPYVIFHTTLFERLIACFRERSNIGFLIYIADASGYLGYIAVMLFRNFGKSGFDHLAFFLHASLLVAAVSIVLMIAALIYFRRQLPRAAFATGTPEPSTSG